MNHKLLRLYIALLVAALSAYGGILYAQANPDITLAPGQTYTVACAKRLLVTGIFTKSVRLICPGDGTVPPITASPTVPPVATATPLPTPIPPTATVGPTPTSLIPTVTNTPIASATPAATVAPSSSMQTWHAPASHDGLNVHEHGAQPQDFFQAWSIAELGRGIVYGGDEASSPTENTMKHQAFKFIVAKSDAGGDVLLRYHAASNPMDRAARYHSYEVYYRDTAGNISFWQGWFDTGDPTTDARCPRRVPAIACENQRPIILVVDETALAQSITGEQWYMFSSPQSGVSWDMGVTIIGATTLYQVGENATAMDMSTWKKTGNLGLRRRSDGFWYLGRGGGGTDLIGWFCSQPLGAVVTVGNKNCPTGSLPQHIAPTLAADARPDGFGNNRVQWLVELDFPGSGVNGPVTVPN